MTETFTDYNAFLKLLGSKAQVVTFDDVPTPIYGIFGSIDPNRYAAQGIVFSGGDGVPSVARDPRAVSAPNVYYAAFLSAGGAFRDLTNVSFTRNGQPAMTSAFGTFFIGNTGVFVPGQGLKSLSGLAIANLTNYIDAGLTSRDGSTFLGLATVDSVTGQLVPAISEISVDANRQNEVYLDNFTFAAPVSPVPEGSAWALLAAAALAVVALDRRRGAA